MMNWIKPFLLALALILGLNACIPSKPSYQPEGTDISNVTWGSDFELKTSTNGQPFKLSDQNGKVVALFFGYTYCPDICPTTMMEYTQVLKKLGEDADQLQVVFVSLDPARDNLVRLKPYVEFFHPNIIGLTGTPAEIQQVADQFKIVANRVNQDDGNYTLDHSAGSYLFDTNGKLRVYEPYGTPSTTLVQDVQGLLNE